MQKQSRGRAEAIQVGGRYRRLPLTVSRPALLVDGSDRDFRRLVHGLFGFLARHEALRNAHAAYIGLNGMEYTVLISIAHLSADGDVSVKVVADHLHLSGAFITTITGALLRKRLIHKRTDRRDRRRVRLTVSEKAYELLAHLAPVQSRANDVEFEALSAAELQQLLRLTERLIAGGDRALLLQARLAAERRAGPVARRPQVRQARNGAHT